ncbi:MAG: 3-phosphoshikimate 1-carboxyvinyltransferase [Chloroflexi bacterium HGW-Chloroflexi-1]|nr:MAG: 3-phosphoshikimate 1-carboxyvinyltransferase [Chloroflexi bacterium HGW-Chloroflexi-1]
MPNLIIRPAGPLRGSVTVPGDKSISHRALLLAALAEGDTLVRGWLPAEDCQATLRCVRGLSVSVDLIEPVSDRAGGHGQETGPSQELLIHGVGMAGLREPTDVLDCGGSGTTMRLLAGILAGQPFTSVMTGNDALRRRPMARIAEPLRRMGATILGRDGGRLAPLTIQGGGLHGIDYPLPVASAQVKSAILLAGLFADGETIVHEPGPARDHTERMLRAFGVPVQVDGPTIRLAGGQRLRVPLDADGRAVIDVPADISSAAFPLVAGAIVPGSEVGLRQVGVNPTRTGLLDLLAEMGCPLDVRQPSALDEPVADIAVRHSALRGVSVGGNVIVRAIDEFPIFAVAATQAEGVTTIRDAGELRVKESDRIAAVAAELTRMGAQIEERPDGLVIHGPTRLTGTIVDSHRDHRLAMALAVAGLVAQGQTTVRDALVIDDSFPGFAEMMQALGADVMWE